MRRAFIILLMCILSLPLFSVTYGRFYTGHVQAQPYSYASELCVPMTNTDYSHTHSAVHSYNYSSIHSNTTSFTTAPFSYRHSKQNLNVYAAAPGGDGQGGQGGGQGGGGKKPGDDTGGGGGGYTPGGGGSSTKTCPMCGGTGYINDNGNGEVVTATWWRVETGYSGDGTFCDGTTVYHDPCDDELYGASYHHDGKRVCPCCGGTGKVSSSVSSNWMSQNHWVSWYGTSWSHLWHDDDGDGHCDEHQWHEVTPIGDIPFYLLIPALSLYAYIRGKKRKGENIYEET